MAKLIIFTHILGVFLFDEHFKIKDSILFSKKEDYLKREVYEAQLKKKYPNAIPPNNEDIKKILAVFKDKKYHDSLYTFNTELTKDALRKSVTEDQLIFQAISNIDDINKISNLLVKRLREWYSYHNPEASHALRDNEKFVELLVNNSLQKDKNSIGTELSKQHLEPIIELARNIISLYSLREKEELYLENLLKEYCPNITMLAGTNIAAKLLQKAGSLKKLSEFPSSTVQLLGAEKALFRHLKNKKNLSPRYGYLHEHQLISQAKNKDKGKVARVLADKISIAARVDYFKGKFIGAILKKELEKKFGSW